MITDSSSDTKTEKKKEKISCVTCSVSAVTCHLDLLFGSVVMIGKSLIPYWVKYPETGISYPNFELFTHLGIFSVSSRAKQEKR